MVNPLVIVFLVSNCSELWECEIVVVYHLHGQTGRFSVWVKGSQSSGLVNFVPESRLPYVQISSIDRKTAAKVWNWYQRWLWRNETRISVWNIPSGKIGLPFQMFRFSRKSSNQATKRKEVDHIPWVWGSVPRYNRKPTFYKDWQSNLIEPQDK